MKLTHADAEAVSRTARYVRLLVRGIISQDELVNALFFNVSGCETNHGIEACVATVPSQHWPRIRSRANEVLAEAEPGRLFMFVGGRTLELGELNNRVCHCLNVMICYLEAPYELAPYLVHDSDGEHHRWFSMQQLDTVPAEKCRHPECNAHRIIYGVFCPAHHFEMIYGKLPPNTGSRE